MVSTQTTYFFITFAAALCCLYLASIVGRRLQVYSKTSFRRLHDSPTPLVGGLAIYASLVCVNLYVMSQTLWGLLLAALPMVVVGLWDDIKEISPRDKLLAQIFSAAIWLYFIPLENLMTYQLGLGTAFACFSAIVLMVGMANFFNFLDGIDGQVGLMSAAIFIALSVMGYSSTANLMLASATLAFLYLNFPPARLYLGEVGSSLLGFATTALVLSSGPFISMWAASAGFVLIFSLPIVDSIYVITRRLRNGNAPWAADKSHFHHKLLKLGLTNKQALLVSGILTVSAAFGGVQLLAISSFKTVHILAFSVICFWMFTYVSVSFLVSHMSRQLQMAGSLYLQKIYPGRPKMFALTQEEDVFVFDFSKYYDELQMIGIQKMEEVFIEIAEHLECDVMVKGFFKLDGHSVAIIVRKDIANYEQKIINTLKRILSENKLLKDSSPVPEGLSLIRGEKLTSLGGSGDGVESLFKNKAV